MVLRACAICLVLTEGARARGTVVPRNSSISKQWPDIGRVRKFSYGY